MELAVKSAEATPAELVAIVMVAVPLLKVPDAPVAGALKTTFVPETGLPNASFTVTASGFVKAALTVADCGVVPAFAVMDAAAPPVFVSEKLTVTPAATAVTM